MNIQVAYFSTTGNTRKVADSIAEALSIKALPISEWNESTVVDILFLGGAIYANHQHGLHSSMKTFIAGLDPKKIRAIAVFGTGFIHSDAVDRLRDLALARGINVVGESFFCLGRFTFFNLAHPNKQDLTDAADFAKRIVMRLS